MAALVPLRAAYPTAAAAAAALYDGHRSSGAAEAAGELEKLRLASQSGSQPMSQASQDENVARLMEMGYDADRASKVCTCSRAESNSIPFSIARQSGQPERQCGAAHGDGL